MPPTDNPATEPVLSDLLYNDHAVTETPRPTEPATTEKEAVEDAESTMEVESPSDTDATVDDPDAEPGEELFDVTDGDTPLKVNRKELIDSYKRQADYTKKTQAVAEDRKVVEAEKARVLSEAKVLTDIQTEIDALIMGDLNQVDWDAVRTTDPSEYLRLKEVEVKRKDALAGLVEKRNQVVRANTAAEGDALHKALNWSDAAKKSKDIDTIVEFCREQGITEQVTSHKLMLAILDAAKYQALEKAKVETLKEVKLAPKTTKPKPTPKTPAPKRLEDLFYK
jgi:hypothetical protein